MIVCGLQLDYYPGVGATPGYHTTVGQVRDFALARGAPDPWPDLPPDTRAVLCYLIGDEPTVPPSWPASSQRPFDVAVVGMLGDGRDQRGTLILTGSRDEIEIKAP